MECGRGIGQAKRHNSKFKGWSSALVPMTRHRTPNLSWELFSTKLLNSYGSNLMMSPYECLAAFKQLDSVDAYIDDFVVRVASIPNFSNPHSMGFFLNDLKEIRVRLLSHEITDNSHTMILAHEIERELFHFHTNTVFLLPLINQTFLMGLAHRPKALNNPALLTLLSPDLWLTLPNLLTKFHTYPPQRSHPLSLP